jgi:hypothetical protein
MKSTAAAHSSSRGVGVSDDDAAGSEAAPSAGLAAEAPAEPEPLGDALGGLPPGAAAPVLAVDGFAFAGCGLGGPDASLTASRLMSRRGTSAATLSGSLATGITFKLLPATMRASAASVSGPTLLEYAAGRLSP